MLEVAVVELEPVRRPGAASLSSRAILSVLGLLEACTITMKSRFQKPAPGESTSPLDAGQTAKH